MQKKKLLLEKKEFFESIYARLNRRDLVHPDPLEFLYNYPKVHDREIVAIIASTLAYGRVAQILKSVTTVLSKMPSPATFLKSVSLESLQSTFRDFKHRFTTGSDVAWLLFGIKCTVEQYGSLEKCFVRGLKKNDETVLPALSKFVKKLVSPLEDKQSFALPLPEKGSACKRLNLFLRWMVRRDEVDLGGWNSVPSSKLIIPLDTHMHKIGLLLGMTKRRQANMCTALEITSAFKKLVPEDPVKYDFALTRLGIRSEIDLETFILNARKTRT